MILKPKTPTNIWNNIDKLMRNQDEISVDSDLSSVSDNLTLILTDINTSKKYNMIDNFIKSPKKKRKIIKKGIIKEIENLSYDIYGEIGLWADEPSHEEEKEINSKLYSLDLLNEVLPDISSSSEDQSSFG